MANRYIYPRGFEDIDPSEAGPGITRGVGDSEVDRLYKEFMADSTVSQSWEFKVAAMRTAKRLFGTNLANWISNQKESEYVGMQSREFLIDTLCFIRTGQRAIHPRNWLDIISIDPVALTNIPPRPLIPAYSLLKSEYSIDFHYLEAWLKHPDGLLDLIYSLYIVFGSSSVTRNNAYAKNPLSPRNPKFARLAQALNNQ